MTTAPPSSALEPSARLALTVLTRYLFFLSRRPVSSSNLHYLASRLEGLKAMSGVLRHAGATIEADSLERLTPWNFAHRAPRLLEQLADTVVAQRDVDFVLSATPPEPLLADCRRIVVVFGPAIGIGDEILASRLVSTLKSLYQHSDLVVASGYAGLWRSLNGGSAVRSYVDYSGFLREVEGDARDPIGLLVLVDFEKPALVEAVSRQPGIRRYVEISLGARCVAIVDAETRWIHRYAVPDPYFENYYACLDHLVEWAFGGARPPQPDPVTPLRPPDPGQRARVFVSPFTSKHEPDGREWSATLATALESVRDVVETVFDSGPGERTARFVAQLERATRLGVGGKVVSRVARSSRGRPLDLAEALAEIEASDVVICADSFAAHLAPRLGKPALILAGAGLSHWKVPGASAFYFEQRGEPRSTGLALRLVLEQLLRPDACSSGLEPLLMPKATDVWRRGRTLAQRLRAVASATASVLDGSHLDNLSAAYDDLGTAHRSLVLDSAAWPEQLQQLASDCRYERCLVPAARLVRRGPLAADAVRYVRDQYERWTTTNLAKSIDLLHRTAPPERASL